MKIGVIGAGAAGLIAGAFAAKGGASVDIIDRNEKTGKKLFLTGKGRCNITNSADIDAFLKNVPHNGRFLYSAFDGFFNDDIIELINSCGVRTKLERGGRYFPESDKSSDVIRALQTNAVRCGANIVLNSRVSSVSKTEDGGFRLCFENGQKKYYDKVIIATGGASYPSTGSTGDGYSFAESLGHTVAAPKPSLIPLVANEAWAGDLMGLSLKNVVLRAYAPEKSKKQNPASHFPGNIPQMNPEMPRKADMLALRRRIRQKSRRNKKAQARLRRTRGDAVHSFRCFGPACAQRKQLSCGFAQRCIA